MLSSPSAPVALAPLIPPVFDALGVPVLLLPEPPLDVVVVVCAPSVLMTVPSEPVE